MNYENWNSPRPDSPSGGMRPDSVHRPDLPNANHQRRKTKADILNRMAETEALSLSDSIDAWASLPEIDDGGPVLPGMEPKGKEPKQQDSVMEYAREHSKRHGFVQPGEESIQHQHNPSLPSGGPELTQATLRMTHFFRQRMAPVWNGPTGPTDRPGPGLPRYGSQSVMSYSSEERAVHDSSGGVRVVGPTPERDLFPCKRSCI